MAKRTYLHITIIGVSSLLLTACGGGMGSRSPESQHIALDQLSPLGAGSAALWTQWVKVDASNIPESSGTTMCASSDAGADFDACVNGGLTRKVKVPGETSCSDVQRMEDSLGAFKWNCVQAQDGSGLWIYSTGFLENKGLGDLIENPSNPNWKEISVAIETSSKRYASSPTRSWSDDLLAAPDSSTTRADLNTQNTLYYLGSNTSGKGFSFGSDNVGLVLLDGSTYTYNGVNSDAVVLIDSRLFIYLEGSFDGGTSADYVVEFATNGSANSFLHLNKLTTVNGTASGLAIPGEAHNVTLSNITSTGNGSYGIFRQGSGSYLKMDFVNIQNNDIGVRVIGVEKTAVSNLVSMDNTQFGFSLITVKDLTVNHVTLSENGLDGLNLIEVENADLADINASSNTEKGVNIVSDSDTLRFTRIETSGNGTIGFFLGGASSAFELNDLKAHDNGSHGFSFDETAQNILGTSFEANRNAGHGLNIVGAVTNLDLSDLSFTGNSQDGFYVGGNSTALRLTRVKSENSGANGATIAQASSIIVDDLSISGATQIGLNIETQAAPVITNATIINSGSHGVGVGSAAEPNLTDISIETAGGYGIYELDGSQSVYSNVSIETTAGDAILMENGAQSTYNGIYFNNIPGYLIRARNGATSDFYDLSYGANVDTSNLYEIDTLSGANVTIH